MKNLLGFVLLFVWGSAFSIPLTWTLQDAVFDDGGTATGSFVYDSDLAVFADIEITTTAGSIFDGQYYQHATFFLTDVSLGVTTADQPDLTGLPALAMFFTGGGFIPMTNAGELYFSILLVVKGIVPFPTAAVRTSIVIYVNLFRALSLPCQSRLQSGCLVRLWRVWAG